MLKASQRDHRTQTNSNLRSFLERLMHHSNESGRNYRKALCTNTFTDRMVSEDSLRELRIIEGSTITMYRRLNGGMKKTQPIEMTTEKERSRTSNSKLDDYLVHGSNTKEIVLKEKKTRK